MQNLKIISDRELHAQTFLAAENEKKATLKLLEYLAEVDDRKLFAVMGYSSLWEYVHQYLKFSESQSSERISAMRLMARLPEQAKEETRKDLQNGSLTLTTLTQLAYHVKKEKLKPEVTSLLLGEIKGKSKREVEKMLAKEAPESLMKDKVRIKTKTTTLITIEVEEDFMQQCKRIKELEGNHALAPQEIFKITMKEYIKKRELKLKRTKVSNSSEENAHHQNSAINTSSTNIQNKNMTSLQPDEVRYTKLKIQSRYISRTVKNSVRARSKDQCEYVCAETNRRCHSKTGLQYDHHLPHAVGGSSTQENIRYLCPAHNQLAAIQFYGKEKMNGYFKKAS